MALTLKENICRGAKPHTDLAVIGRRANLLSAMERELVHAVLIRGQTASSLARLAGVNGTTIRRRVRKIARRMFSRSFIAAARTLAYLERQDAQIARLRYCEGLSPRQISRQMGLTHYRTRRRLDKIAAQMELVGRLAPASPGGQSDPVAQAACS